MLFGFCRQWVWVETHRFLEGGGYEFQAIHTSPGIMQALRRIIQQNKWPVNSSRTLPLLYLLGKAKSLIEQCILWRPIAAVVEPQIQRFFLRTAVRAFPLLLNLLVQEITACFLVLHITDLQPWIHGLPEWGCTIVGDCNCSGQFNNVTP